jgi:gliding motility-associated lipoprotein GldD
MYRHQFLLFLYFITSLYACRTKRADEALSYTPKPKGYPRLDIPKHAYKVLQGQYPYSFEISTQAIVKKDTFPGAEPHWIFLHYPQFHADIQLTYKPLAGNKTKLQALIKDAHSLTFKHNVKAYSIQEKIYTAPSGSKANILDLEGEVPSQVQFYTTDSTKHYLRGALYFKTSMANDSLQPVIQHIREDIVHLINTLSWKK